MAPTRRTILRTTGLLTTGALAGCTAARRDSNEPMRTPDDADDSDEPTELPPGESPADAGGTRPSGTGGPGVSLRSVDDAPALPVEPTVEVTEPVATDEHPPQLRLTVENTSDERVKVGEGRSIFFQYVSDDSRSLVLLPADGDYPADPGCWRLSEGIATTAEYRIVAFDPGESRSELLDLYATPDDGSDACLPVGEFRFEADYAVESLRLGTPGSDDESTSDGGGSSSSQNDGESTADRVRARWGFSLALE